MDKNTLPVEPVSTGRFWVYVTAKEFDGHRGVTFKLFRQSALDSEVYATVLAPGLDRDCPYLRSAVEETFDAAEVEALREWFSQCWEVPPDFRIEQAPPITGNQMGHSMLPISGLQGFYRFSELEDFPLPCEVYGYYDLRFADSGPFDNPQPGRDDAEGGCYVPEDEDEDEDDCHILEDDRRILVGGYCRANASKSISPCSERHYGNSPRPSKSPQVAVIKQLVESRAFALRLRGHATREGQRMTTADEVLSAYGALPEAEQRRVRA